MPVVKINNAMKNAMLLVGLLLLFAGEILRIYFIMPFPGSQHINTIWLAYWIGKNVIWIRFLAFTFIVIPSIGIIKSGKNWRKIAVASVLTAYAMIFFFFNFRFEADKMFLKPKHKKFITAIEDTTNRNKLVIGVVINGEARAYPIQIIGYHHQVMDTIGKTPVMVTYCTVCRTGRVYSPFINGKKGNFRLVGMDHYNAMFEDAATGTWWQQATGKAIAGPLKGSTFKQIPFQQLSLAAWLRQYPTSLVMQPDTNFKKDYNDLAKYDNGTIKGSLEKRDSASWKPKSWVVGVLYKSTAKAYDWNQLVGQKIINDSVELLPVLLTIENDGASFHVFNRVLKGQTLFFTTVDKNLFIDKNTNSTWNMDGICVNGKWKGEKLNTVQAYQEFWHSWSTFHPKTLKYTANTNYTTLEPKKTFYDYL